MNAPTRLLLAALVAVLLGFMPQATGHLAARTLLPAPGAAALTVRVGDVSGSGDRVPVVAHLTSKAGSPVAQARILFYIDGTRDGEAVTDSAGNAAWRIRSALSVGKHDIRAEFGGSDQWAAAVATSAVTIAGTTLTLHAPPAGGAGPESIVAHLTTTGGTAVAGVPVVFFVDNARNGETQTDAAGNATWTPRQETAVGQHTVKAVFDGTPLLRPTQASVPLAIQPTTLQVRVPAASAAAGDQALVAHLANEAGQPIAAARVTFLVDGTRDGEANTDAQGDARWTLRTELIAGAHTVEAVFEGRPTLHSAHATASLPVEATTLTVQMGEATAAGDRAPVIAQLSTAAGQPVAGARITFLVDGARNGESRTGADGKATWGLNGSLEAGKHTVTAVFDGTATRRAAQATTPYALGISTLVLSTTPAQVQVGQLFVVNAHVTNAAGEPITGTRVLFLVNGERDGEARTDKSGTAQWRLRRELHAGTYTLEAVFDGVPGALPSRTALALDMAPATVELQTVPALPGVRFALGEQIFVADANGVAHLTADVPGTYHLKVLPWDNAPADMQAEFARWSDDNLAAERDLVIPSKDLYQVGFNITYRVHPKFVDLDNRPIDASRVTTFTLTSSNGKSRISNRGEALWLPGSRAIRQPQGLEQSKTVYAVESVIVDGSNVVNQAQQRFTPSLQQEWPIQLMFYSVHFRAQDAFFGFPLGNKVRLQYPDGQERVIDLNAQSEVDVAALARGPYKANVLGAPGMAPQTPVVLSQNAQVDLPVLSVLDIALMALIGLCFMVGLLFFGRPYLLRLMHQYAVGGARRVPGARQAWRAINRQLGPSGQRIGLLLAGEPAAHRPPAPSLPATTLLDPTAASADQAASVEDPDPQMAELIRRLEATEQERDALRSRLEARARTPVPPPPKRVGRNRTPASRTSRPSNQITVPYATESN
jgi:hypothetical protein